MTRKKVNFGDFKSEEEILAALNFYIISKFRTNKEAAEALGVSPPYLSQVKNGTRPIPDSVLEDLGFVRVEAYLSKKLVTADNFPF